ncbi:phosphotransferase family protein [Paenibacillus wulumuqiensis]|uniref:phosphotransferase family protein n=1 Tax=Paenibacillus wulumuqiensis TaxID=1567107 RepID=UPI000619FB42|nr:aminoglycoside phosphotransferase family protein [Paenibacillus wulumuqiensis]
MKENWEHSGLAAGLTQPEIEQMIAAAFPDQKLLQAERTGTGLSSGTYKIHLEHTDTPYLLRISAGGAATAQMEQAIAAKVEASVPVARYIRLDTSGTVSPHAWSILEWKEGILLRDMLQSAGEQQIAEAAAAVGTALARIHEYSFEEHGFFAPDLSIADPFVMGADGFLSFIEESLQPDQSGQWLDKPVQEALWDFCLLHSPLLSGLTELPLLVHSDFNGLNLLLTTDSAGIKVSAVLDWEFTFSGSRYVDIGNMLRYEQEQSLYEQHFIQAYRQAGGQLDDQWRLLSRLQELIALLDMLNRSTAEMPVRIADLQRLIARTIILPTL